MTDPMLARTGSREQVLLLRTSELQQRLGCGGCGSNNSNSNNNSQLPSQRLVNDQHVDKIYKSLKSQIVEHKQAPVLPGCLVVCVCAPSSKKWLVDGNHRFKAYSKLLACDGEDLEFFVNWVAVDDEAAAKTVFDLVNKSVPIPRMPQGISMQKPNRVLQHFQDRYPQCFSHATKTDTCRRPHLHPSALQTALGHVLRHKKDLSAEQIIKELASYNTLLQRKSWRFFQHKPRDTQAAIEKLMRTASSKGGLFLGLFADYDWLYDLFKVPPPEQEEGDHDKDGDCEAAHGDDTKSDAGPGAKSVKAAKEETKRTRK
jgi:hypothetical protein